MAQISTVNIPQLRRNAKRLAREQGLLYSQVLDRLAGDCGYPNWSQLMKQCAVQAPAEVVSSPLRSRAAVRQLLGLPRMEASRDEHKIIMAIVKRYGSLIGDDLEFDPLSIMMDLEACHSNGCPLDLVELLNAPRDTDFAHDIGGIGRHLNRDTGRLDEGFTPRYALASLDSSAAAP